MDLFDDDAHNKIKMKQKPHNPQENIYLFFCCATISCVIHE